MKNNTQVITGAGINMYRLVSLKYALQMEIVGMKHSKGLSAYAIIKKEFGFTGNKKTVLKKYTEYLDKNFPKEKGAK